MNNVILNSKNIDSKKIEEKALRFVKNVMAYTLIVPGHFKFSPSRNIERLADYIISLSLMSLEKTEAVVKKIILKLARKGHPELFLFYCKNNHLVSQNNNDLFWDHVFCVFKKAYKRKMRQGDFFNPFRKNYSVFMNYLDIIVEIFPGLWWEIYLSFVKYFVLNISIKYKEQFMVCSRTKLEKQKLSKILKMFSFLTKHCKNQYIKESLIFVIGDEIVKISKYRLDEIMFQSKFLEDFSKMGKEVLGNLK